MTTQGKLLTPPKKPGFFKAQLEPLFPPEFVHKAQFIAHSSLGAMVRTVAQGSSGKFHFSLVLLYFVEIVRFMALFSYFMKNPATFALTGLGWEMYLK